ncbi:response regulator [Inquilinus sp. Marseille-Q2685]|uniref:response regulator n=1 Tax=Inquilinus sp. Marseille-Q2685 TaxID=2866581 RepID=UPI001CE3DFC3|nr:response regulator [Inquilinus sp. Marseille-Q2685]
MSSPTRILIVEDEFLVALLMEETVRNLGHEVVGPVGDLPAAMRLAEAERLSAAILDVHLQHGERVYPVVGILRRRGIPLVLTTAYRDTEIDADCAGEMLLRKPFDQLELEQCIARLVRPSSAAESGARAS